MFLFMLTMAGGGAFANSFGNLLNDFMHFIFSSIKKRFKRKDKVLTVSKSNDETYSAEEIQKIYSNFQITLIEQMRDLTPEQTADVMLKLADTIAKHQKT